MDYRSYFAYRWGIYSTLKKNLLIVGAGGFGREVYSMLLNHPDNGEKWRIKGFLDDGKFNANLSNDPLMTYDVKVINNIDEYKVEKNDAFIIAIGEPRIKEVIVSKLRIKEVEFFSFIHPSATIGLNVNMGKGVIVCPNVTITCDINIGDFVTVNANSTIGHDSKIGDYSTLSGHCDVTGYCELGKSVFMGSHASVVPKTKVENYAVIGAGSLGIRKVKAHTTILGVPGKKINY